jgi:hypothetical protein
MVIPLKRKTLEEVKRTFVRVVHEREMLTPAAGFHKHPGEKILGLAQTSENGMFRGRVG